MKTATLLAAATLILTGIGSAASAAALPAPAAAPTQTPAAAAAHQWTQIDAAGDVTCGIDTDAAAWCWGNNGTYGNLGNGAAKNTAAPTPVRVTGLPPVRTLATGLNMTGQCAVTTSNQTWCWGNIAESRTAKPIRALDGAVTVSVGGDIQKPVACVTTPQRTIKCIGNDQFNVVSLAKKVRNATSVSVGATHACATDTDNAVWCWGLQEKMQLGIPVGDNQGPVKVPGIGKARQVSAGHGFSCAALTDGTAACWGDNYFGQLGRGTTGKYTGAAPVDNLTGVTSVTASNATACAVTRNGDGYCWGSNFVGQLGNGTKTATATPARVKIPARLAAISAGSATGCAVTRTGDGYCWGSANRLGNGQAAHAATPVPVR